MSTTLSQPRPEAAGAPVRRPKLVVALGGNALLQRGETASADVQRKHAAEAIAEVAKLADQFDIVLTHGNGPQVGLLALQSLAYSEVPPYPLDVLGAESEGMIGYVLELELENRLPGRPVATILTQVIVDEDDPGFENPTKFVGPVYDKETAEKLAADRGWTIKPDGKYFRRVVPSPEPKGIVEIKSIRHLVDFGAIVICSGGGGIPVVRQPDYILRGVEAVIDKDLAGELLAESLGADFFLMLTDVPAVELDWGTPEAKPLRETTVAELRKLSFASGSMGPKVEAACRFAERTGGIAAIGALEQAVDIVAGRAGTIVKA
ncbi:MAG TPA: carbamate kinase [Gaiellaceae bacterium]